VFGKGNRRARNAIVPVAAVQASLFKAIAVRMSFFSSSSGPASASATYSTDHRVAVRRRRADVDLPALRRHRMTDLPAWKSAAWTLPAARP